MLARHPGATIVRTETNRGSRTTIDGTELEVLVNKDFDAVDGRRARNRADRG